MSKPTAIEMLTRLLENAKQQEGEALVKFQERAAAREALQQALEQVQKHCDAGGE